MQFLTTSITILSAFSATAFASSCGVDGVVNGQCGEVFDHENCDSNVVHHIVPDCSQTCIKVSDKKVVSVKAFGDGTRGTTCYLYEDENCTQEVANTGNQILGGGACENAVNQEVKSWKCTFAC